jgi:hypothetical protein
MQRGQPPERFDEVKMQEQQKEVMAEKRGRR